VIRRPGISAISIFLPRHRVDLERWCEWTHAPWAKVAAVVGRSFRVCGPDENAYTMAASAVLRVIVDNRIDPRSVGFLGLGTESSTDNSAGTVIVKGMVDQGLRALGLPALARECEVPEFKQACLGGVYATKAAARWLACEGRGRTAIAVSSDIAEYQRGSSGEQTQGAGAVAFLLEAEPRLLELDLQHAASASRYRGFDFRKPVARHFLDEAGRWGAGERPRDYPVFNGKYSTLCYVDEVIAALDGMFAKLSGNRSEFWSSLAAVFMHRPYHHLPPTALASALVFDMILDEAGRARLTELAAQAKVDPAAVFEQIDRARAESFDLFGEALARGSEHDPFAAANAVARVFRSSEWFAAFERDKLALGSEAVREFGNLYTGSLPAWLAAGLSDAARRNVELAGRGILMLGYGSGDAAEAIPATVVPGWQEQAKAIAIDRALAGAIDLTREQYETLHEGKPFAGMQGEPAGFAVERVGRRNDREFQDLGVEYYRFTGGL
jgi:hydroxymethylglutaryl-CoA synthase